MAVPELYLTMLNLWLWVALRGLSEQTQPTSLGMQQMSNKAG